MYKHRKTFNFDRLSAREKKTLQIQLEKMDNEVDRLRVDDHRVEVTIANIHHYDTMASPNGWPITANHPEDTTLIEEGIVVGMISGPAGGRTQEAWAVVYLPSRNYLAGRIVISDDLTADLQREALQQGTDILLQQRSQDEETASNGEGDQVAI